MKVKETGYRSYVCCLRVTDLGGSSSHIHHSPVPTIRRCTLEWKTRTQSVRCRSSSIRIGYVRTHVDVNKIAGQDGPDCAAGFCLLLKWLSMQRTDVRSHLSLVARLYKWMRRHTYGIPCFQAFFGFWAWGNDFSKSAGRPLPKDAKRVHRVRAKFFRQTCTQLPYHRPGSMRTDSRLRACTNAWDNASDYYKPPSVMIG